MRCHRVCKWLKGKDIGAQSNITQRNSLEEVRRIIVHNGGKSSMHQDVTHFERAQTYPEEIVEYGADAGMWEHQKTISRICNTFTIQRRLKRNYSQAA